MAFSVTTIISYDSHLKSLSRFFKTLISSTYFIIISIVDFHIWFNPGINVAPNT